ncbi:outer membrane lipoprotein carrier protein LolA [Roseibium sp. RKSG952]|uniref:outer membrane lipoprotein carrier protein LolA n=1 Tax=Roseibium sp. RKSG952 TaxID=2529384 RepID=UPI0012BBD677|nr:outer membrane lipoprotein carrier protein LolA [Roseibium sp. RKSG952]MTH97161.1 outer membrane lipoprotein carrier protein LolA [Roseibium sp. RKSG952]
MLKRSVSALMCKAALAGALVIATLSPGWALTDDEQKSLSDVNSYFNSIKTMHGDFIQFGPDGTQTDGKFYISRPGKVRFYYNPPAKLDIIADGKSVSVRDRKLATQDIWPLNKTPLRFLLSDTINLQKDANVTNVLVEPDLITVTIEDKTAFNSGLLTLIFDAKDYKLKQWTVTDSQGYDTSVAIYNTVANGPTNPDLFEIDYLANARQNRF